MPKNNKRIFSGYYRRYDDKRIFVIMVVCDADTNEEIVICKEATYSPNAKYFTMTKSSFCEKVEWNGNMVDKFRRITKYNGSVGDWMLLEADGFERPESKKKLEEPKPRYYRRAKDYYSFAKDLCENYSADIEKYNLCVSMKRYIDISKKDFSSVKEDLKFLQGCLKTTLKEYEEYFEQRFIQGLSIRKYAEKHHLNRGSVEHLQKKLFTALAIELQARDISDGNNRLWHPQDEEE